MVITLSGIDHLWTKVIVGWMENNRRMENNKGSMENVEWMGLTGFARKGNRSEV